MFQAEGKSIFPCSEKSNWVSFICFVTRPPFIFPSVFGVARTFIVDV